MNHSIVAINNEFNQNIYIIIFDLCPSLQVLLVVAAMIALARAGGPAAYSIVAPSGDHASVGSVHEHTVKVSPLWGYNESIDCRGL